MGRTQGVKKVSSPPMKAIPKETGSKYTSHGLLSINRKSEALNSKS